MAQSLAADPTATPVRRTSWLPLLAIAGVFLFCAAYLAFRGFNFAPPMRTPIRFVLPTGFTGNVKVLYETPGAPPLPVEAGYRVLAIPPDGVLKTSSPLEYGKAPDKIERILPAGGTEELGVEYLKIRRNGLQGDNKEFFQSTDELAERDARFRAEGRVSPDGKNILGPPYELLVIRSTFEPPDAQ